MNCLSVWLGSLSTPPTPLHSFLFLHSFYSKVNFEGWQSELPKEPEATNADAADDKEGEEKGEEEGEEKEEGEGEEEDVFLAKEDVSGEEGVTLKETEPSKHIVPEVKVQDESDI